MSAELTRMKFNIHDVERMVKAGMFAGNERVELIEGELIQMAPQGNNHISSIIRLTSFLTSRAGENVLVSVQNAVIINDINEPQPDISLLRFRDDYYSTAKAKPEDILLLIEVSDSTVTYDRKVKVPLYARNGVAEVWVVNLPKKIVEVYSHLENGKYKVVKKLERGETLSPKLIPLLKIKVDEIIG